MTPSTAKNHLYNIYNKLGITGRSGLILLTQAADNLR